MTDKLTLYKSRSLLRKSSWRWSYQAAGNNERMGNGGEAYDSLAACAEGAFRVCGISAPHALMISQYEGSYTRAGVPDVQVVVKRRG